MNPQDYLDQAIVPVAQALGIYTLPHLQIGFGTTAQESGFRDVEQSGGGPAIGPDQEEGATHNSLWANFVKFRPNILSALNCMLGRDADDTDIPDPQLMMTNLVYAAAMMFVRYLDAPGAIPSDLAGQANYYLTNYNAGGKATMAEYIANWNAFAPSVTFPSNLVA